MKNPSLFKKKRDQAWYTVIGGKHKYLGKDYEKALEKARGLIGLTEAPTTEHSLSKVIDRYIKYCRYNQSKDTVINKISTYKAFLNRFGDVDIASITVDDLEQYRQERLETRDKTTINTEHNRLSALWQWCVEKKIIRENPWWSIKKLKVVENLDIDTLTDEEVDCLFSLAEASPNYIIRNTNKLTISLMVNCGLRCIEVTRLKWEDIKFDERVLVVREGKGTKSRRIPLNDEILNHLIEAPRFCDYVVCSARKGKIARSSIRNRMERFLEQLGHTHRGKVILHLHSLRATFATRLSRVGVSPFTIQQLLGHASVKTTERYCASSMEYMREAVSRLSRGQTTTS